MEIVKIVGLGFAAVLLGAAVKQKRPEFALEVSLAAASLIFFFVLGKIGAIVRAFADLAMKAGIAPAYLYILLKIIAVAYITEFGVQLCRDAGENAVAAKVELAGKVVVLAAALPILQLVFDAITHLAE